MAFEINDTSPRDQYTASGGQTVFTISFEFLANADIKAYLTPAGSDADDSADLLTLTTDYTLVGAGSNGTKELTLVTPATAGDVVTILRDDAVARDTEFLSSGDLTIASMNQELDKIITLIQQVEMNQEQRSLMFRRAAQLAGVSLVIPKPEATKMLGWNSSADALVNYAIENSKYFGSLASAPASNPYTGGSLAAGDMYFDTSAGLMMVYNGSSFGDIASSVATAANAVSISDAGDWFAGLDVEAALQEAGASFFTNLDTYLSALNTIETAAGDVDTTYKSGIYRCSPSTQNTPVSEYGFLEVFNLDDDTLTIMQRFTSSTGGLHVWVRQASGGVWGGWIKVRTETDIGNGALIYRTTDRVVGNFSSNKITWDTEVYDTHGIFDSAVNQFHMFVPTGISRVKVSTQVSMRQPTGGVTSCRVWVEILKNGSSFIGGAAGAHDIILSGDSAPVNITSPVLHVSPGDYFAVNVYQESGASQNIAGDAGGNLTWFTMELIK